MSLTVSYLKQQEEYSEKYGEKTIVLMQVGNFMEIYEINPEKCETPLPWPTKKIGLATEVAALLNIILTRKDKGKPYSLNNCAMAGFPIVSYEKHRDLLLANDYTIVKIEQKKDNKDNIERFVGEILSPATNLENIAALPVTNNIVSVYIEVMKDSLCKEDYSLAIGLSTIDVTTGENSVFEVYSKTEDTIYALQELYRFLNQIKPRELILNLNYNTKDESKISTYEEYLTSTLELGKIPICVFSANKFDKNFLKVEYWLQFLTKAFFPIKNSKLKIKSNPQIIENLGLERIQYGIVSYLLLLQHCKEHNESLIERLSKPNTSWIDVEKYLILTHNAISQLDLLPSGIVKKHNRISKNIDSLFSVVNYTKTPLGKRHLINMLTNPITNVEKLKEIYNMTEDLIFNPILLDDLRGILKDMPDLERYQRKLCLKLIKPKEFVTLFTAYIQIIHIYKKISEHNLSLLKILFEPTSFNECLNLVLSKYKLEILKNYKLENSKLVQIEGEEENEEEEEEEKEIINLFYPGADPKADKYWADINNCKKKIKEITNELNSHLESTKGKKITYCSKTKKDRNLSLWTTPHKANVLLKSQYDKNICGELKITNLGKEVMITSDIIAEVCNKLFLYSEDLSKYLFSCYNCTLYDISNKYTFFPTLNNFLSQIDYLCSNAKCSLENKYFKPEIEGERSFVEIEDMRHPLIENLINGSYVPNNISLGKDEKGMLLYGMNSSGKSSLAKAIALNVILAQAGLYTAGKMKFYPYNRIITRLSGHDSILTGESSFIIEMKELRTILRNADERSLVIGDELSRGTETISATCLTVSSILSLIEKKSSFIFSSHLHIVSSMKEILNLGKKLKICHLALEYDPVKKIIIYDRKLKEGSGDSVYGLEVANSLDLEETFINRAYQIRNELIKDNNLFLSNKKSRYNSKIYVDSCFLCGERNVSKLVTHHINEQKNADKNGFIGTTHKNVPSNLADICVDCHKYLHANNLTISTLETSQGISFSRG